MYLIRLYLYVKFMTAYQNVLIFYLECNGNIWNTVYKCGLFLKSFMLKILRNFYNSFEAETAGDGER